MATQTSSVVVFNDKREVLLILREDARVWALPAGGLEPGELVRDQFALLIPPTLPAGRYEIQVGVYDARTFMRRSLVESESGTVVVVEQLDVR